MIHNAADDDVGSVGAASIVDDDVDNNLLLIFVWNMVNQFELTSILQNILLSLWVRL